MSVMSLSYLCNNSFHYQDIPANALIYRAGTSGFEVIQPAEGVLMSDGTSYSFGVPSAAQLVSNYTGNSIVMTCNNKLVEVPIEGTSQNKILRQIDGQWKIVDFSVQYIKPELYDPSSWQLWIADSDIHVINIPKNDSNTYAVNYDTEADQFNITRLNIVQSASIGHISISHWMPSSGAAISDVAIINKVDLSQSITSYDTSSLSLIYCSNKKSIFNGKISNYIQNPPSLVYSNATYIMIHGGILIENYNDYTQGAQIIAIVKNGDDVYYKKDATFMHVETAVKYNNNVIIPVSIIVKDSTDTINLNNPQIYIGIYTNTTDTATYHWYYLRNFIEIYVY